MRRRLVDGVPLALAVLPYLPVLAGGYFQADDFAFVRLLHSLSLGEWTRLFISDPTPGIWGEPMRELRPFVYLFYRLDFAIWGLNATGYHLTNILVHALNSWLMFRLARRILPPVSGAAWLAAALFAVAPCHVEAVSWINGRTDLFGASFFLAASLLFVGYRDGGTARQYWASVACYAAGLFAKETILSLPLLMTLYEFWRRPPRRWASLAPFLALTVGSLMLRRVLFGGILRAYAHSGSELLLRQRFYLEALLFPTQEWPYIRPALLVLLVVGIAAARRHWRTLLLVGPLWYVAGVLPALTTYPASRHLYIASVGISMALGLTIAALPQARVAAACFWLGVHGVSVTSWARHWAGAGTVSRKWAEGVETLTAGLPPGSTVLLAGSGYWPAYVWEWAIPYALEPPFSRLYSRYRFIEHPEWYCCLEWERIRQPDLAAALASGAYVIRWDATRAQPALESVSAERLQTLWREAAGQRFSAGPLTREQGLKFFGRLRSPP